MEGKVELV